MTQEVTLSTTDGGPIDFLLFGPHHSVFPATRSSCQVRGCGWQPQTGSGDEAATGLALGAEGEGYLSVAVRPDGRDEAAVPLDALHQAVMAGGAAGLQSGREGALRRKTQDKQRAECQRGKNGKTANISSETQSAPEPPAA